MDRNNEQKGKSCCEEHKRSVTDNHSQAIVLLVGSVPIVFTKDIGIQAGGQVTGSIENPKGYQNAKTGDCECE